MIVAGWQAAGITTNQMERCRRRLEEFLGEMLAPLGRSERRHWGAVYVRGLLSDGERKSIGAMALRLPEANEQSLQQFLSQSPWAWSQSGSLWRRRYLALSPLRRG